ncbi:MAG: hypothetical protein H7Y18_11970 [Clostridiaceae bacterium]|nr:hypothetical protein [Clostridiaceae bacterium]
MKNKVNNINNSMDDNIEKVLYDIRDKFINTDLSPQAIEHNCNKTYKKFSLKSVFIIGCFLVIFICAGFTYKHFIFNNSAYDNGVNNADPKGYVQPLNVSCINNNIKINLLGAINDGERVLLQARIFQDGKELNFSDISFSGIQLVTASGEAYNSLRFGGGNAQKSSEANIIEFPAKITKDQSLALRIKSLNNIVGNWELKFPIQGESSITYPCDFSQKVDNMNFQVSSITVSKTQIKVKVVMTGELAFYRADGTIYCGNEKGSEISAQGYNTGTANQHSEEITYEYISLAGAKNILIDFSFFNPKDINGKKNQYRVSVPLNMK